MKYAIVKILDDGATLAEVVAAFIADGKDNMSRATYYTRRYLCPHFIQFMDRKHVKIASQVTPEHIREWRDELLIKYQGNTVHLYLRTVGLLFKFAINRGIVFVNPVTGIKKPRPTATGRALTADDRDRFFAELPKRFHPICKFALYSGMRISEACSLDWKFVTDEYIRVPAEHSKNGKERFIVLSDEAKRHMGPRTVGLVFKVSRGYLQTAITKTWRKMGLGRIRFHDFRVTAATNYPDNEPLGMALNFGWTDMRSVMRYRKFDLQSQQGIKRLKY
jgi:integrase